VLWEVRPARVGCGLGGLVGFGWFGLVEGHEVVEGFELALKAAGAVLD
jgi:hypothetical protein